MLILIPGLTTGKADEFNRWVQQIGQIVQPRESSQRPVLRVQRTRSIERPPSPLADDPPVVEAWERVDDPLGAVPRVPFGHLNSVWRSLKAAMQPGDELWSFASTRDETKHIWAGVSGYAIRRDGRIAAEVVMGGG